MEIHKKPRRKNNTNISEKEKKGRTKNNPEQRVDEGGRVCARRAQRDGKAMEDRFTTLPELLFDGGFTRTTDAQIGFDTLDTVRFARTVCIHDIHVMFVFASFDTDAPRSTS